MKNKRLIGKQYEEKAVQYLQKLKFNIITTNFRCRIGEIDIIAKDGDYLVFLEVKYRKDLRKGYPSQAVNYYKQKTITKVAQFYLLKNGLSFETPCRFDVVVIIGDNIKLLKNAFSAVF